MATSVTNTIEYIIMLVGGFAYNNGITETEAYRYLKSYDAIALCEKHYAIMHTLSLEENINTLREFCQRKGGSI